MLTKEPDGEVMKKYKDFGYAMDKVHEPARDEYARDLPYDMKGWCTKLWKAVALQLIVSAVIMRCAHTPPLGTVTDATPPHG